MYDRGLLDIANVALMLEHADDKESRRSYGLASASRYSDGPAP